jgi:hypothetical protein
MSAFISIADLANLRRPHPQARRQASLGLPLGLAKLDLLLAQGDLSGRKRKGGFMPPPPPPAPMPGYQPASGQPPQAFDEDGNPIQTLAPAPGAPASLAPAAPPPWFGQAASVNFPPLSSAVLTPLPAGSTPPAAGLASYTNRYGRLTSIVHFISPGSGESFYDDTAVVRKGDVGMAAMNGVIGDSEEMVLDGLTGGDVMRSPQVMDMVIETVDAGGQAPVDEPVSSSSFSLDDGGQVEFEGDVLVEPGQVSVDAPMPNEDGPPVPPSLNSSRNGNGNGGRNGNGNNGNRLPRNGAHRHNGNPSNGNGNGGAATIQGGVNRSQIARRPAYQNAAPLVQGTGAATMRRRRTEGPGNPKPRGAIEMSPDQGPPDPAAFGLGQTSSPSPQTPTTAPQPAGVPWMVVGVSAIGIGSILYAGYRWYQNRNTNEPEARSNLPKRKHKKGR